MGSMLHAFLHVSPIVNRKKDRKAAIACIETTLASYVMTTLSRSYVLTFVAVLGCAAPSCIGLNAAIMSDPGTLVEAGPMTATGCG